MLRTTEEIAGDWKWAGVCAGNTLSVEYEELFGLERHNRPRPALPGTAATAAVLVRGVPRRATLGYEPTNSRGRYGFIPTPLHPHLPAPYCPTLAAKAVAAVATARITSVSTARGKLKLHPGPKRTANFPRKGY